MTARKLRERRLAAQHAVTSTLAEASSLAEAAPKILRSIGENLEWEVGAIWLVDRRADALRRVAMWHSPAKSAPEFEALSASLTFTRGIGLPGRIWSSGEPAWIRDVVQDGNFPRGPVASKEGLHAAFGFPICLGRELLGVVEFFSREIREPDDDLLRMASAIGAQLGQFVERKRAEEEVRESEERLRFALEAARTWTWDWDLKSGKLTWSDNVATIFGNQGEAFGRRSPDFLRSVHPADREIVARALDRALNEGSEYNVEYRLQTRDRECWISVKGRATRDETGKSVRMAGVGTDISDRKRIEARLRDETETLELLNRIGKVLSAELDLENLVEAVTETATKLSGAKLGAFFYEVVNERGERQTRYAVSGVPREAFESFPIPRQTALFGPALRGEGVIRVDDVTRDERYGKNPPYDGLPEGHLPVRSYLALPVLSRSGEVLGALVFGHPEPASFTERHERVVLGLAAQAAIAIDNARLYEAERRARADAEASSRAKDEFLAMLGHELRNPIAAIAASVRALETDGSRSDLLGVISRQTSNLKRIVDDLLDVSRLTSGKIELRQGPVRLDEVAERFLATMRAAGRADKHTIELTTEAIAVRGDPTRLEQILSNLLDNALKYTPEGRRIRVVVARESDRAVLAVEDEGIGIPSEIMPQIFDLFAQGEQALDRSRGGLGLGLTLVRRLVELHGGTVEASSPGPGRGSRFAVRLPVIAVDEERPAPSPAPDSQARRHVLIIEDHRDAREALRALLELSGHRVDVAEDGPAGLEIALASRPEVALVDIGLPGMDGYEVARRMRTEDSGHPIYMIALTGYGQPFDRRRAIDAGFDRHLVKPLDYDELTRILAAVGDGEEMRRP